MEMILLVLVISLSLSLATQCPTASDKVIVCYYSSWAIYREGIGYFNNSHIDPNLCTHLVYTFAGLDLDSKISSLDPYNDIQQGSYNSFTKLKEVNPCLKTLLAIGGWNEGSKKYSVMSYTQKSREIFADSVLRFIVAYDFDGLDLDWEYPTQRGGLPEDKENFVQLLKTLHDKLKIWKLMLTVAVPISITLSEKAYDITKIAPYVDYVLLMAYDATSANSKTTGLSAPLNLIKTTVEWWLKHLKPNQLVLGIATYARSFTLEEASNNGIGANASSSGGPGMYTGEAGFLSYYELQTKLNTNRYVKVLTSDTYYAYYKTEWLTFDLPDSYTKKVNYAKEMNLRGVMVWSIDTDDFLGTQSSSNPYPILKTINRVLYEE